MADKVPAKGVRKMARDTASLARRTREVERPSGTQYARLLDQVTEKLEQIDQEVADAISAQSYTKAQLDSMFQSRDNAINGKANAAHTHDAADVVSGTISVSVDTTGNVAAQNVFARSLATNITDSRVALWGRTADGFIGTASSSERFKKNIQDWDGDPEKVLQMMPVYYQYIEQCDIADAQRVGTVPYAYIPSAKAHTELGFIAERLVELGFWEVIVWQRDDNNQIVLDDAGNPVPFGIHYHLIAVLQQSALQWLNRRLQRIETQLGLTPLK